MRKKEIKVAMYDFQASEVPLELVSLFFYRSRINCFNFITVSDLKAKVAVMCFWNETEAKHDAVIIGSSSLLTSEIYSFKSKTVILDCIQTIFVDSRKINSAWAYVVSKMVIKSIIQKF